MEGSQLLLFDRQGTDIQGLGLPILALCLVEESEIVEAGSRVRMGGSQLLLSDHQHSHVQGLGFPILALCLVESSQGESIPCGIKMLFSLHLLTDRQGPLKQRLCLSVAGTFRYIPPCLVQELSRLGDGQMVLPH